MNFFNFSTRENYGQFVSFVGICVNILLSGVKFAIALISGSISILADAANNLSDAFTAIIMLFGFKIAAKPADEKHPFGHGRAEYLSGLFVAAGMILVGGDLLLESIKKILHPEELSAGLFTMFVLSFSLTTKFFLGIFYRHAARKIDSETIKAASLDSFVDCLATGVVMISIGVYIEFGVNFDGGAGVFISAFILRGGFNSLNEILNPLLGGRADPKFLAEIENFVMQTPEIIGVHDIIVHNYGVKRFFVSMHVEMSADLKLLDAHEIVDRLERKLQSNFQISATLHIDPVVRDEIFDEHCKLAEKILSQLDSRLTLHDFRVVPYKSGRKLIFDVAVPQNFSMSDRELRKEFQRRLIAQHSNDRAIIHVDHEYC